MARTYAVADLHGRSDLLEASLARIEASQGGGTVVFTGDYVDRGPASKQVLDRLMAGPTKAGWRWVCLKGNHEDMMVGAIRGEYEPGWWIGNGGAATVDSFDGEHPQRYVDWAADLPLFHADRHRVFVHAGLDETLPLAEQTEQTLLWSRVPRQRDYCHEAGYVVHGHTPFEDGPVVLEGRANLDTGAFWTGRLVVAVFDDDVPGKPVDLITIRVDALEPAA
jgi:serine/threonine protein phosphatase 1